ncbi:MAG: VWA domain-containing protein [Bacteroidetes bacterium]|nr:VWA domain-containing protein [Bacteroidota bacterium]
MFENYNFANPLFLILLLVVPIIVYWFFFYKKNKVTAIDYPTLKNLEVIPLTLREKIKNLPNILRILVILFAILALARPQSKIKSEVVKTEGIDIILAIDISASMLAEDLKPNRIEAAKKVGQQFVTQRMNDRIGLVVFSGESFTQCPLTIDYNILQNSIQNIKHGVVEDGTAIGLGIANSINRLKESKSKSKVIILLTDGVNNRGEIDPLTAAEIALQFGIKIYTVATGTFGTAPYPIETPFGKQYQMVPVEIDEKTLRQVSNRTGGKFYRATKYSELKNIYSEIDKLEKTKINVRSYTRHKDLFYFPLSLCLVFLFLELTISQTYLKRIP